MVWVGRTNLTSRPSQNFATRWTSALEEVRLPYPHEAGDQLVVEDVVGGCTLWNELNLRAA